MDTQKYLAEGSDYQFSVNKLMGKKIKDITGFVAHLDVPVLKICNVLFEDGTSIRINGEHDMPYLYMDDIPESNWNEIYDDEDTKEEETIED